MKKSHTLLSDEKLLEQTSLAAKTEKEATLKLLEYLLEVESRKLYASRSFFSLFDYVVHGLGYSESQAAERVAAVRLMQDVPASQSKIENGELSVSAAAQIQRFFKAEVKAARTDGVRAVDRLSFERKSEILEKCLGRSKRDVEKVLLSEMSDTARIQTKESIRPITSQRTEIKFTLDDSAMKQLREIKNWVGDWSLEEIFSRALNALHELEGKKRGVDSVSPRGERVAEEGGVQEGVLGNDLDSTLKVRMEASPGRVQKKSGDLNSNQRSEGSELIQNQKTTPPAEWMKDLLEKPGGHRSRYIPMSYRREIYRRSQGRCEFWDEKNKIRCESRFRLQIDHIQPIALAGKTELSNLRHLCPEHNLHAARELGLNRNERYRRS